MDEKLIIICEKCNHHNTVYKSDMDWKSISYEKPDFQMGAEVEHYCNHTIFCEKCGKEIEIDYSAWEYPTGCFETSNIEILGGELLSGFNEVEMFQEKLYDFDEEIGLYLPRKEEIITNLNIGIAKLILEAENNPELINYIDHREFEEFVSDLFKRQGFTVELTPRTRDGGRDIIAIRSDHDIKAKYIIECKKYGFSNKIDVNVVRQLYGVQQAEGANKAVLVTTSKFTRDAIDFANREKTKWHLDLIDYQSLVAWIKKIYGDDFLSLF